MEGLEKVGGAFLPGGAFEGTPDPSYSYDWTLFGEDDAFAGSAVASPLTDLPFFSPQPFGILDHAGHQSFNSYDHTPPASENWPPQPLDISSVSGVGVSDVAEQQQQRNDMVIDSLSSTYNVLYSNRSLLQAPQPIGVYHTQAQFDLPTPSNTSVAEGFSCGDFILGYRSGIRLLAGQKLSELRSELIFNVDVTHHKVQHTPKTSLSGLRALQIGLAQHSRQRPPQISELSALLVSAGYDLAGKSLPAHALWAILTLYGSRVNEQYRLGIVSGGCADADAYDIYGYEMDSYRQVSDVKTIWLYNDNAERIESWASNQWSAIAPDSVHNNSNAPQTWASVAALPRSSTVDPSRLHPHYTIPIRAKSQVPEPKPSTAARHAPKTIGPKRGTTRPVMEIKRTAHQCGTCHKFYQDLNSLNHHERIHRDKKLTCHYCRKGFLWQKDLDRHLPTHTGRKDYRCGVAGCSRQFTRKDNLRRHCLNDHPELPPPSAQSSNSFNSSRR